MNILMFFWDVLEVGILKSLAGVDITLDELHFAVQKAAVPICFIFWKCIQVGTCVNNFLKEYVIDNSTSQNVCTPLWNRVLESYAC